MTHSPGGDAAYRQIDIYICMWRHSKICVVINDKSQGTQPSILVVRGYFITNLLFNLLVNDFLKSVNIW